MQAEGRRGETAGNAGSLIRRTLPSLNALGLSLMGCKAQSVGAGCLRLSQKVSTHKNGVPGWHGRAAGTQENIEAVRREKPRDRRECWEPPQNASLILEYPRRVLGGL